MDGDLSEVPEIVRSVGRLKIIPGLGLITDLDGNDLSDIAWSDLPEGADGVRLFPEVLSAALGKNTTVKHLLLSGGDSVDVCIEGGVEAFRQSLAENESINFISIHAKGGGDGFYQTVCQALRDNQSVTRLQITTSVQARLSIEPLLELLLVSSSIEVVDCGWMPLLKSQFGCFLDVVKRGQIHSFEVEDYTEDDPVGYKRSVGDEVVDHACLMHLIDALTGSRMLRLDLKVPYRQDANDFVNRLNDLQKQRLADCPLVIRMDRAMSLGPPFYGLTDQYNELGEQMREILFGLDDDEDAYVQEARQKLSRFLDENSGSGLFDAESMGRQLTALANPVENPALGGVAGSVAAHGHFGSGDKRSSGNEGGGLAKKPRG